MCVSAFIMLNTKHFQEELDNRRHLYKYEWVLLSIFRIDDQKNLHITLQSISLFSNKQKKD